jgi:hypothetical protein
LHGIARHKVADSYRRRGRLPVPTSDVDQNAAEPSPSTGELEQWIESELPKNDSAQMTLHWLLREGDGDSLDEIARDADVPAPRVRQRVSRLRRHFHARWLALGAAGLLLLLGVGALFQRALEPANFPPSITREPFTPLERARSLRQNALERCAARAYPECVAGLDQAAALDPSGESASAIRDARNAAAHFNQSKLSPEQSAPSKLAPKPVAPGASTQKKAVPIELAPSSYDHRPGNELPTKASMSKKR